MMRKKAIKRIERARGQRAAREGFALAQEREEPDASIVCRKEPDGSVYCEWRGGRRAVLHEGLIRMKQEAGEIARGESPIGKTLDFGGVRVLVVDFALAPTGAYGYSFLAMRADDPRAKWTMLYRQAVRWLAARSLSAEARVRGLMLQPLEGREPVAARWIHEHLL